MQFTTAPEYETVIKSIILHIVVSTKICKITKKKKATNMVKFLPKKTRQ